MLLLLLTCIQLSFASEDYNFNCKPKPGCDFSQCGEIPQHLLDIEGFDEVEYRKRNQHHITCQPSFDMKQLKSDDEGQLNMEDVKEAINKLEVRLNQSEKERNDMKKVIQYLVNKVDSLTKVDPTQNSQQEIVTEKPESSVLCDIKWEEKCYWVITKPSRTVQFKDAVEICKENGGTPANVYSADHYREIALYLRNKHPSVAIWIGMRVGKEGKLYFYNGDLAPFVKWAGQFQEGVYSHMGLYVSRFARLSGMYSYGPDVHSLQGVICEK